VSAKSFFETPKRIVQPTEFATYETVRLGGELAASINGAKFRGSFEGSQRSAVTVTTLQALTAWRAFFTTAGIASAAMIGLTIVAASIRISRAAATMHASPQRALQLPLGTLCYALLVCLCMLAPVRSEAAGRLILGAIGIAGACSVGSLVRAYARSWPAPSRKAQTYAATAVLGAFAVLLGRELIPAMPAVAAAPALAVVILLSVGMAILSDYFTHGMRGANATPASTRGRLGSEPPSGTGSD
jgi:hypothetical protein